MKDKPSAPTTSNFRNLAKIAWHEYGGLGTAAKTEAMMRKYRTLRPSAYADEVHELIKRATSEIRLDLDTELHRISERSGMSRDSAMHDLVKAGLLSQFSANKSRGGGAHQ